MQLVFANAPPIPFGYHLAVGALGALLLGWLWCRWAGRTVGAWWWPAAAGAGAAAALLLVASGSDSRGLLAFVVGGLAGRAVGGVLARPGIHA